MSTKHKGTVSVATNGVANGQTANGMAGNAGNGGNGADPEILSPSRAPDHKSEEDSPTIGKGKKKRRNKDVEKQTDNSDEIDEEDLFVESILDLRIKRGRIEVLTKWKGWANKHNTWEPLANITSPEGCDALSRFWVERERTMESEHKAEVRDLRKQLAEKDSKLKRELAVKDQKINALSRQIEEGKEAAEQEIASILEQLKSYNAIAESSAESKEIVFKTPSKRKSLGASSTSIPTWEFESELGWTAFSEEQQELLEQAFKAGEHKLQINVEETSASYAINLQQMQQENLKTGFKRQIRRTEQTFAQLPTTPVRVSYSHRWTFPMNGNCVAIDIEPGSSEWTKMELRLKDLDDQELVSVVRIQNKHLWKRFSLKQAELAKKNAPNAAGEIASSSSTRTLFHGSWTTPPPVIYRSETGLDSRLSAAGFYGRGIYFAVQARYSLAGYAHMVELPCGTKAKQLFVARVACGATKDYGSQIDRSLTRPPQQAPGSDKLYDSVSGFHDNSKIYVVYNNDQAYPDYVVTIAPRGTAPCKSEEMVSLGLGPAYYAMNPSLAPAPQPQPQPQPAPANPVAPRPSPPIASVLLNPQGTSPSVSIALGPISNSAPLASAPAPAPASVQSSVASNASPLASVQQTAAPSSSGLAPPPKMPSFAIPPGMQNAPAPAQPNSSSATSNTAAWTVFPANATASPSAPASQSTPGVASSVPLPAMKFVISQRVEALRGGQWLPATIFEVRPATQTYKVVFCDASVEVVAAHNVREPQEKAVPTQGKYAADTVCKAMWKTDGWFNAKILGAVKEGGRTLYNIRYDDGVHATLDEDKITVASPAAAAIASSVPAVQQQAAASGNSGPAIPAGIPANPSSLATATSSYQHNNASNGQATPPAAGVTRPASPVSPILVSAPAPASKGPLHGLFAALSAAASVFNPSAAPASQTAPAVTSSMKFCMNQRVDGLRNGQWLPATIIRVFCYIQKYALVFCDAAVDTVAATDVREPQEKAVATQAKYAAGTPCKAGWDTGWLAAKILGAVTEGGRILYNVRYDDGMYATLTEDKIIAAVPAAQTTPAP